MQVEERERERAHTERALTNSFAGARYGFTSERKREREKEREGGRR